MFPDCYAEAESDTQPNAESDTQPNAESDTQPNAEADTLTCLALAVRDYSSEASWPWERDPSLRSG